jgi:formylglycine-generating enzyme required for sulfatase activity
MEPQELDLTDLDGPAWVRLEGGTFRMGSERGSADTRPVHEVRVSSFRISCYPVTNAQYAEFVRATGRAAPKHWPDGDAPADREIHPVTGVSWHDAHAFCAWLSERVAVGTEGAHLPTEAQWEFAARGAERREYPWGGERPTPERTNYQESAIEDTSPVGSYPAGATPDGVHDLAGNVRQWCLDWYGEYDAEPQTDPAGPAAGEGRALRGGGYVDAPGTLRGSYRFTVDPDSSFGFVGFRVAWSSHGRPEARR